MTNWSITDLAVAVSRGNVVTLDGVGLSVGPYQCAVPGWPGWAVIDLRTNAPLVLGWDAFAVCDAAHSWLSNPDDLEAQRAMGEAEVLPTAAELADEALQARVQSVTCELVDQWLYWRRQASVRGSQRRAGGCSVR